MTDPGTSFTDELLGFLGIVMSASGLQELTGFVYRSDTVEHMLSGKAVSRALQAHLLIQSALVTLLLQCIVTRATQESAEITYDNDSTLTADDVPLQT